MWLQVEFDFDFAATLLGTCLAPALLGSWLRCCPVLRASLILRAIMRANRLLNLKG